MLRETRAEHLILKKLITMNTASFFAVCLIGIMHSITFTVAAPLNNTNSDTGAHVVVNARSNMAELEADGNLSQRWTGALHATSTSEREFQEVAFICAHTAFLMMAGTADVDLGQGFTSTYNTTTLERFCHIWVRKVIAINFHGVVHLLLNRKANHYYVS